MSMQPITKRFADWVVARVRAAIPEEWRADVPVYDERELDLAQRINEAVNGGCGACWAVSMPTLRQEGDSAPGNTQYRVQVEIGLTHNAGLKSELDSLALAETVFRAFVGAEFDAGGFLAYDVGADSLMSDANGMKLTHVFSVHYILTI